MDVISTVKIGEFATRARFKISENGQEVARATVYLLVNDLHPDKKFAFLEDVFVDDQCRGKGYGKAIVQEAINYAAANAYKMIATTRHPRGHHVYDLYAKLGFEPHGTEFRMNFE